MTIRGFLTVLAIAAFIGLIGHISETKRAHAKQIAQLTTNCQR